MFLLVLLLCVVSVLCFLGAAFGATFRNINLIALGLLFFSLVPLIQLLSDSV